MTLKYSLSVKFVKIETIVNFLFVSSQLCVKELNVHCVDSENLLYLFYISGSIFLKEKNFISLVTFSILK